MSSPKLSLKNSYLALEVDDAEADDEIGSVTSLGDVDLAEDRCKIISTPDGISRLVDALASLPTHPPSLYLDLEGAELSRHGTISILQLYILPHDTTYLLDVFTLQEQAFSTPGSQVTTTLQDLLESDEIPKVIFDIRNDSDALFAHYGIRLAGFQDIQLMELATRTFQRKFITGLSKCIDRDALLDQDEKLGWKEAKEKGMALFAPERGGSYEVFNSRPLSYEILQYCIQDVKFLPQLWLLYKSRMSPIWALRVEKATAERIILSQSDSYDPYGKDKVFAPFEWAKY